MLITDTQIAQYIQQYFLPFVRIGMMLMVMPIIGSRIVNTRVRLVLAMLISMLVVPLLPSLPAVPPLSWQALWFVVQELLLGALIGFVFQIVFQMFVLSGQYMAMKMGLGFASMNDPSNGVQTTVLSQFFLMLLTLTFVAVDGHLVLIMMLVKSFQTLPPGHFLVDSVDLLRLVQMGGWMFAAALLMALPVITALLFVNIAFGVMSRAAPQLNIFAVGFPFTLMCGLLLIWLGLTNFSEIFESATEYGLQQIGEILKF